MSKKVELIDPLAPARREMELATLSENSAGAKAITGICGKPEDTFYPVKFDPATRAVWPIKKA